MQCTMRLRRRRKRFTTVAVAVAVFGPPEDIVPRASRLLSFTSSGTAWSLEAPGERVQPSWAACLLSLCVLVGCTTAAAAQLRGRP